MTIIGIDPGLSGAIALLDPCKPTQLIDVFDMPIHTLARGGKTRRSLDPQALIAIINRPLEHVFIEAAQAMPHQGVSSTFEFGRNFGIVIGVVATLEHPCTFVQAAKWKRSLQVPKAKDAARARASQLFPSAAHYWKLVKHDGRAEASLIALYGTRLLGNGAV
jgi:crossover junction endodeoxyribonuclease RuvC